MVNLISQAYNVSSLYFIVEEAGFTFLPNSVLLLLLFFQNLSSTVNLEHVNLPKGIHISYDSHCPDTTKEGQPYGACSGVKINQMVCSYMYGIYNKYVYTSIVI